MGFIKNLIPPSVFDLFADELERPQNLIELEEHKTEAVNKKAAADIQFSDLLDEEEPNPADSESSKSKKAKRKKKKAETKPKPEAKAEDKGEEKSGDYISLGKKLMSLARSMMPKHRDYTPIAKKLAQVVLNDHENIEKNLKKLANVIRRELRSLPLDQGVLTHEITKRLQELTPDIPWVLGTFDEVFTQPHKAVMTELNFHDGLIPEKPDTTAIFAPFEKVGGAPDFSLCGIFDKGVPVTHFKRTAEREDRVLYLFCPSVWGDVVLSGLQLTSGNKTGKHFRHAKSIRLEDPAYAIAYLYMLQTGFSGLLSEDFPKTVLFKEMADVCRLSVGRPVYERDESASRQYARLKHGQVNADDVVSVPVKDRIFLLSSVFFRGNADQAEEFRSVMKETIGMKDIFISPRRLSGVPEENPLWFYLEDNLSDSALSAVKEQWDKGWKIGDIERAVKGQREIEVVNLKDIFCLLIQKISDSEGGVKTATAKKLFSSMLMVDGEFNGGCASFPYLKWSSASYGCIYEMFFKVFLGIQTMLAHEVKEIEEEEEEKKEHAKSFETKRNIPKKILEIMEKSVLNERFGYIEYDERCDTQKIETVNAQILSFVDTYFPGIDLKSVSLRFRRLGNHRASGLYYSFYRCICVEIQCPSSFVHEFGHMLDFLHGKLSNRLRSREFDRVYQRYVSLLEKKIRGCAKDDKRVLYLTRNKKLDYYKKETEVFARCFEMYIHEKLGLENTICLNSEEFGTFDGGKAELVYHIKDEDFMKEVVSYFDALEIMKGVVEGAKALEEVENKKGEEDKKEEPSAA